MTPSDTQNTGDTRIDVLGVRVSATDLETAVDRIEGWILSNTRQYVCVRDVHGIIAAQSDPELIEIHNRAGLVTPDGMPLVWCGRRAGARWTRRVYGPELMLSVCESTAQHGFRHFFYGAAPGVPEELARKLQQKIPNIEIVGVHSPPYRELTDDEVVETAAMINATGADIVWVGLSTPKQERWMARFRSRLDAAVLIGVGAAFDIHAGRVRQAPRWIRQSGFEWLFRLCTEPRRLWRRYFKSIPRFIAKIALNPPRVVESHSSKPEL